MIVCLRVCLSVCLLFCTLVFPEQPACREAAFPDIMGAPRGVKPQKRLRGGKKSKWPTAGRSVAAAQRRLCGAGRRMLASPGNMCARARTDGDRLHGQQARSRAYANLPASCALFSCHTSLFARNGLAPPVPAVSHAQCCTQQASCISPTHIFKKTWFFDTNPGFFQIP